MVHCFLSASRKCLFQLTVIALYTGCGDGNAPPAATGTVHGSPVASTTQTIASTPVPAQTQFTIGNKRYLFDVTSHSTEDMVALLQRTAEITQDMPADLDDLEIVMILHGPDLDWFTRRNYDKNREMVDLAARLDVLEIIDIKACETAMESRGIDSSELPAFIETIPYAPDEIARLQALDYVTL